MQRYLVLALLGALALGSCRPALDSGREEDSDQGEAEYERNDDTASDDYLSEDQDAPVDEVEQKSYRREGIFQDSQERDTSHDIEQNSPKSGYMKISENNLENEQDHRGFVNSNREDYANSPGKVVSDRFQSVDDEASNVGDAKEFYPRRSLFKRLRNEPANVNGRSPYAASEYAGDLFIKNKPTRADADVQNKKLEIDEKIQHNFKQNHNDFQSNTKDQRDETKYKFENKYDRDRRQVNVGTEESSDITSTAREKEGDVANENSENAIIRSIKKLSERDLEDLLNSLPEDKKAVLKKIMDKREITKKAGAVEENSFLDGGPSDTSKVEGFSADSKTDSSFSSNTPETSKNTEAEEVLSTKVPDSSAPEASGGKSEIISNTDIKDDKSAIQNSDTNAKNDASLKLDPKDTSKNGNKRETNILKNGISSNDMNDGLDTKETINVAEDIEHLCSEGENWLDNDEPKAINTLANAHKREVSEKDATDSENCVNSLEDSFPNDNYADSNLESDMVPLIRVKRTEKNAVRKNIHSVSDGKVPFPPRVEIENCNYNERDKDYGTIEAKSSYALNDRNVESNKGAQKSQMQLSTGVGSDIQKFEFDKTGLGTDTDSVITGVEGVDDNLMYNSAVREKRSKGNSNNNGVADDIMKRNVRTVEPINMEIQSDNSINMAQVQDTESFAPQSSSFQENVSRYKRVRQIEQFPSFQERNV